MRRAALTVAVIASLLVPFHALGSMGIGCDGVLAAGSCCCPTPPRSEVDDCDDGDSVPTVEGVCCCEIQPVSASSAAPQVAATPTAPTAPAAGAPVGEADAPTEPPAPLSPPTARAQPPPVGSLFAQHVALLL